MRSILQEPIQPRPEDLKTKAFMNLLDDLFSSPNAEVEYHTSRLYVSLESVAEGESPPDLSVLIVAISEVLAKYFRVNRVSSKVINLVLNQILDSARSGHPWTILPTRQV